MQPKIIKRETMHLTGLTGDDSKTSEVWNDFDCKYGKTPFPTVNDDGYEIRFLQNRTTGKIPDKDKSVHVGFLADTAGNTDGFTTVALPAAEYAVFDVYVAKGYDSGNEEMEKWLVGNASVYHMREFNEFEYVVECYNEKFKGGNKPDSIVEIWIPIERI